MIINVWKYSCHVKSHQHKERNIQNVDILYYSVSAVLNVQETINLYKRTDARSFELEFTTALELCHTLYLLESDAHSRTCAFNYKKGNKPADMAVTFRSSRCEWTSLHVLSFLNEIFLNFLQSLKRLME